jgi:hypothetical protein
MFHLFTLGIALFADEPHAWRGPSTTFTIDDFVGPDHGPAARATGLSPVDHPAAPHLSATAG